MEDKKPLKPSYENVKVNLMYNKVETEAMTTKNIAMLIKDLNMTSEYKI